MRTRLTRTTCSNTTTRYVNVVNDHNVMHARRPHKNAKTMRYVPRPLLRLEHLMESPYHATTNDGAHVTQGLQSQYSVQAPPRARRVSPIRLPLRPLPLRPHTTDSQTRTPRAQERRSIERTTMSVAHVTANDRLQVHATCVKEPSPSCLVASRRSHGCNRANNPHALASTAHRAPRRRARLVEERQGAASKRAPCADGDSWRARALAHSR